MEQEALPPLAPELSPRYKRQLYAEAGVDRRIPYRPGVDRTVVPNVLVDDTVPGLNDSLSTEMNAYMSKRLPQIQQERMARELEQRQTAERTHREKVESATTISLRDRPDPFIAEFIASRDDLFGATNFEVRLAMQQNSKYCNAMRNLLTTEKKKAVRSRHYPVPKAPREPRTVTPQSPRPPPGNALRRWYFKVGMLSPPQGGEAAAH